MFRNGTDYLAFRVRRFSVVAMVISPLVAAYHFYIYSISSMENSFNLGFGLAMILWGATFIYPRKLAHYKNTYKQKKVAFILFILALFSALIWFPLNAAITNS